MAMQAKAELQARKVTVERKRLLEQLRENRAQHLQRYGEAIAGYVQQVKAKMHEEYERGMAGAARQFTKVLAQVDEFDPLRPELTRDTWKVTDSISVTLAVPRNYIDMYDAAIAIAEWETGAEMELSYAEFQCFVRDEWDWKDEFSRVTMSYGAQGPQGYQGFQGLQGAK